MLQKHLKEWVRGEVLAMVEWVAMHVGSLYAVCIILKARIKDLLCWGSLVSSVHVDGCGVTVLVGVNVPTSSGGLRAPQPVRVVLHSGMQASTVDVGGRASALALSGGDAHAIVKRLERVASPTDGIVGESAFVTMLASAVLRTVLIPQLPDIACGAACLAITVLLHRGSVWRRADHLEPSACRAAIVCAVGSALVDAGVPMSGALIGVCLPNGGYLVGHARRLAPTVDSKLDVRILAMNCVRRCTLLLAMRYCDDIFRELYLCASPRSEYDDGFEEDFRLSRKKRKRSKKKGMARPVDMPTR